MYDPVGMFEERKELSIKEFFPFFQGLSFH